MIARKLASLEMFLRGCIANNQPLTEFGMLHVAEQLHSLAELAEALEARPLPPRLRLVQGGKPDHGSAA